MFLEKVTRKSVTCEIFLDSLKNSKLRGTCFIGLGGDGRPCSGALCLNIWAQLCLLISRLRKIFLSNRDPSIAEDEPVANNETQSSLHINLLPNRSQLRLCQLRPPCLYSYRLQ